VGVFRVVGKLVEIGLDVYVGYSLWNNGDEDLAMRYVESNNVYKKRKILRLYRHREIARMRGQNASSATRDALYTERYLESGRRRGDDYDDDD